MAAIDVSSFSQDHSLEPASVGDISMLNHKVLQRHLPHLRTILQRASYVVIYTFSASTENWEKSGIEGTLFVVELNAIANSASPRYALFILNRRGLDNWMIELQNSDGIQITDEYVIIQDQGFDESAKHVTPASERIWGLWIFDEDDGSTKGQRHSIASHIKSLAQIAEDSIRSFKLTSPVPANTRIAAPSSPDLMAILTGAKSKPVLSPAETTSKAAAPNGADLLAHLFQNAKR